MKKIIFGMMALAAITGCNGDYEDWAAPQTNNQVDPLTINVNIQPTTTNIDMNQDVDKSIALFDCVSDNEAIIKLTADVIIDGHDTIPGTCRDGQLFVEANDVERVLTLWKGEHKAVTYTDINVAVDVDAYFADGDAVYFNSTRKLNLTVAGIPEYAGGFSATLESADAGTFEKQADGTYKIVVNTTDNNSTILFYGRNGSETVALGSYIEGDTSLSGVLAMGNAAKGIVIPTVGRWSVIIDLVNGTYTIKEAPVMENWYLIGNCIGDGSWGSDIGTAVLPLYVKEGTTLDENGLGVLSYTGYLTTGGFKLVKTPGQWDDQWGSSDGALTPVKNDGGSQNFTVPSDGVYTVELNTVTDELTVTAYSGDVTVYNEMLISGDFNGWGNAWMNPVNTFAGAVNHDWYFDLDASSGETTAKFLQNGWAPNWGDSAFPYGTGINNGDNIPIKAGSYRVFFNDITGVYLFLSK